MIQEYTGQDIDNGVVRFTADWCVPCKTFAPVFESAAAGTDVPFYVIDVEEYPELAQSKGVMSIPAVFSVLEGEWVRWGKTPTLEQLVLEAQILAG